MKILFLYSFSLNYVYSSFVFFEELKKNSDSKKINMLDVNQKEINEIDQEIKKADIVVFDNSILIAIAINGILPRNFFIPNKKNTLFYRNVWYLVSKSNKPICLLLFASDLHAKNFGLERELFLDIITKASVIFWPYFSFPFDPIKDEKVINSFFIKNNNLNVQDIFDNWKEIISTIKINIDLPHCISFSEMCKNNSIKKWDIVIPGADYQTRKIAISSAQKECLNIAPYIKFRRWFINIPYRIYNSVLPNRISTLIHQKNSFALYKSLIKHSSVTFACGGDLKYFVRKFLEIPAFRSAMVAYPSENFTDYGFEDGIHYLKCMPEQTADMAKFILNNKSFANKIVENAWVLVKEKHSAQARVSQVLDCIDAFGRGKLKGARFYQGKFEIY